MKKVEEHKRPPGWAIRFLEWFCPDELLEGILGDILEQYEEDAQVFASRKAKRKFVWNVLRFFHPAILFRNHLSVNLIHMGMLKSHLLVAFRSMKKYKFYTAINILGLSFAIGFVFLSFLFIQKEMAVDQFHSQKDSIYRLYHKITNVETGEASNISAVTAIPLAKDLSADIPAIRQFTRHGSSSGTVRTNNTPFAELITFVDTGFLKMFDFPLLKGDINTALNQPNSVILTKENAIKFFGDSNPIGQSLLIDLGDTTLNAQVSGLIDARQDQSSIPFGILLPFEQFKAVIPSHMFTSYQVSLVENYILFDQDLPENEIEAQLTAAIQKYAPPKERRTELGVQPLSKIHLEDEVIGNAQYTSPQKLYIMIALALLVLIIATINFITLSTSHGLNRMKEMGLRKTLGALKRQLSGQLIIEAIFISLIASFFGLLIANLLTPTFASLVESSVQFSLDLPNILFLLSITLLIGLIAGFFQAIVLVKYKASQTLKGNFKLSGSKSWFNQSLVVVQFSLSVLLIIGAICIWNQMRYIQTKDLGFDQEKLLEISMENPSDPETAKLLLDRFRTESKKDHRILSVGASMNNSREPWTELKIEQQDGTQEAIYFNQVDPAYLETLEIELLSGAGFRESTSSESNGILVNEALVRHFGWEDPLSQQIPGKNLTEGHQILGVIKDFHFSSLHQGIEPLVLALDANNTIASGITGLSTYVWPPNLYQLEVRIGDGEVKPIIDHLKEVWNRVNPNKEFVYHFVDEVLEAKYAEEKRWAKIINLGSFFAIGIAWLGLLGLMQLSVQKRTKEIGIRKVLGSSTTNVILLLSKKFLLLVAIGIIIAWPIGWLVISRWLQSFTYRIDLNPLWFIVAGLGVLLITFSSVGLQSLRAARSNPVEALRFE